MTDKRYSIKITKDVHDRLCQFQCKKETFSQAIDRLLKVWEGFHSLSQIVGGMHEFADYQEKQRIGASAPIVGGMHESADSKDKQAQKTE